TNSKERKPICSFKIAVSFPTIAEISTRYRFGWLGLHKLGLDTARGSRLKLPSFEIETVCFLLMISFPLGLNIFVCNKASFTPSGFQKLPLRVTFAPFKLG